MKASDGKYAKNTEIERKQGTFYKVGGREVFFRNRRMGKFLANRIGNGIIFGKVKLGKFPTDSERFRK